MTPERLTSPTVGLTPTMPLADDGLTISVYSAEPGSRWQFERVGYFNVDRSTPGPAHRSSTAS